LRWFAVTLTASILAVMFAVLPAGAKEGVKATLTTSIPLDASEGTQLRVSWRLFFLDGKGERKPYNANGVFVRLRSASGADTKDGFALGAAHQTGDYRATVVVPKGGIGDVEIGLEGWSSDASGTRRSDALFTITNDPLPGGGGIVSPASEGRDSTTWGLLIGASGLTVLALLGVAVVLRRRQGRSATADAIKSPSRRGHAHRRESRTSPNKLAS
jgi:hypothetical protein